MKLLEAVLASLGAATFVLAVETVAVLFLEGSHFAGLLRQHLTAPELWITYAGIFLVPAVAFWILERIWVRFLPACRPATFLLLLVVLGLPLAHAPSVLGPAVQRALADLRLLLPAAIVALIASVWLFRAARARRKAPFDVAIAILTFGLCGLAVANVCLILRSAEQVLSAKGLLPVAFGVLVAFVGAVPLLVALHGAIRRPSARRFAAALGAYAAAYAAVVALTPMGSSGLPSARPEGQGRPSVLLIVIDTLREDVVTSESSGLTPNIARLGRDAVWFDRAYAPSPWTTPSFASIFTSTHPSRHNAGYRDPAWGFRHPMTRSLPTLAERLSQAGYWTGAVSSNPHLSRQFGLDRGFHVYRNLISAWTYHAVLAALRERGLIPGRGAYYVIARDQTARARRLIREGLDSGRPFFAMVHYMDPHSPYHAPQTLGNAPKNAESMTDRYHAEVAYVDHYVGELLQGLRADGIYDDLMIILTSDHGEELTELRQNPPSGRRVRDHGHTLFNEAIRVPLLVKYPGNASAETRRDDLVSLIDLGPTTLEVLGLSEPEEFIGRSLVDQPIDAGERVLFAEGIAHGPEQKSCVRANDKVILHALPPHADYATAYDLAADPGEKNPLTILDGGGRFMELYDLLEGFVLSQEAVSDTIAVEIDPHILRQLKALGYVN